MDDIWIDNTAMLIGGYQYDFPTKEAFLDRIQFKFGINKYTVNNIKEIDFQCWVDDIDYIHSGWMIDIQDSMCSTKCIDFETELYHKCLNILPHKICTITWQSRHVFVVFMVNQDDPYRVVVDQIILN